MGHRGHSALRGRPYGPDPFGSAIKDRARIAQGAAKLIAEHGITDWSLAKRKAARELLLTARTALPDDEEVEAALAEYHALFGGEAHRLRLRGQREEALVWMRRLAAFAPVLVGGVAKGWATEWSDIRLELVAADDKAVEILLLDRQVPFRSMHADRDGPIDLFIETPRGGLRLTVRSPNDAQQRGNRDRHGREAVRLDAAALSALLDESR
jgi:hypothetical protein